MYRGTIDALNSDVVQRGNKGVFENRGYIVVEIEMTSAVSIGYYADHNSFCILFFFIEKH